MNITVSVKISASDDIYFAHVLLSRDDDSEDEFF